VLAVDGLEQAHEARTPMLSPERTASSNGMACRRRESGRGRAEARRRLAAVIHFQLGLARIPIKNEGAAADAARLRLDEVQHELSSDRGVDGRAAGAQHLAAGLGRIPVGRRDHVPLGGSEGMSFGAGIRLRRAARIGQLRMGGGGDQHCQETTCPSPRRAPGKARGRAGTHGGGHGEPAGWREQVLYQLRALCCRAQCPSAGQPG
jgi:hypothetical protein